MASHDLEQGNPAIEARRNDGALDSRAPNRASDMTAVNGAESRAESPKVPSEPHDQDRDGKIARDQRRSSRVPEEGNQYDHDDSDDRTHKEPEDDDFHGEDEYTALLHFITNAEKMKPADEDGEDEEDVVHKRIWYMPWKTREIRGAGRVPAEWLETDMQQGLTGGEAESRLKRVGPNELSAAKENQFKKVLGYFRGPILYCMEAAVALAGGLQDWVDFGVIIAILALNGFVGWYQEKQAGDIVEKLKAGIALKAVVIRDGKEQEIDAAQCVPGDILVIEEGKTIPGDAILLADYGDKDQSKARNILERKRLSEKGKGVGTKGAQGAPGQASRKEAESRDRTKQRQGEGGEKDADGDEEEEHDDEEEVDKGPAICSVDQSAMTGESLAVDKFHGDVVYYTTISKRGKCYARMTTTAAKSFVGKTAGLVTGSKDQGHFQRVMNIIGTTLLVLVVIFLFAVWIGGFFRSVGISSPKDNNLLVYTLIFLIVGVPVGLPCVTTTTLAVGAAYLAKKQAIVQRLTAVESLAGCDILCSDKTGTLTANKLSIHEPFVPEGVDVNWMMCVAALASSHNVKLLDPIDKITIMTIKDYPEARRMLAEGKWKTHSFRPFDPVSKRITAEVESNGKRFTCAKGAPNSILKLANLSADKAKTYKDTAQDFASRGFRSLGVAVQEQGGDWQVLGILPMFDPPRRDTAQTIDEAFDLGVRIKMLTGDAVAIAKETCKMLHMGQNIYDSDRLLNSEMGGSQLYDFVEGADGFAEVFPEHKYKIVEMLQQRGHLTAMTGDGVNDAPALKKADCGIAVEGASDAARSAAAVVFLDEGLSTIITSIKVARQIFHRMKAYIVYRIALCLHLEIYLMLSMIILNETIRADLVVFLALFADVATIAIAYDKAPYARRPVEWQLPKIWFMSTVLGMLLAAGTWTIRGTLFLDPSGNKGGIVQRYGSVQEILFLEVALTENWLIFLTRLGDGEFTMPSWQLVGAVLAVDVIATFITLFGWLSGAAPHNGHTDFVTIVRVWAFSLAVIVVLSVVYFLLNQWTWLNNLGRSKRGKIDRRVEDFISELQRITVVHERDSEGTGPDVYKVVGHHPGEADD